MLFAKFKPISLLCCWLIISSSPYQEVAASAANEDSLSKPMERQLRLPLSAQLSTLDPGLAYENVDIEVIEQLFLGLTDFDPRNYDIIPALAIDWRSTADGKTYLYTLRQDAQWSDGTPVTAHDVVWAIQRNLNPNTDSLSVSMLFVLKNAQAIYQQNLSMSSLGVQALDDHTLEFNLEKSVAYFPALTSFAVYNPLPKQAINSHQHNWTKPEHIQTNAAYQLKTWQAGKQLVLAKNPRYYAADQVQISGIHYLIIADSSLALAMYKKDELDVIGGQTYLPIPKLEITKIKANPSLRKQQRLSAEFCTEWLGFTVQQPPLDNVWVRKAIAAAIDKKTLIDVALKSEHALANTFSRPPVFGAIDTQQRPKTGIRFDPIDAKAWLAKGGYPQGKNFPPLFLVYNQSGQQRIAAEAVKAMLKHHLNINVEVRGLDFERYLSTLKNPDKPLMFRMIWCSDYPDAHDWLHTAFHPSEGLNWIGWQQPKFGKIVNKAQRVIDPLKRQRLYQRAEKILTETEAAIIPLYFKNDAYLVKPWLKNWQHHGFGGQHIRNWSFVK